MEEEKFERKTFASHHSRKVFDTTIIVNLLRAAIYFAAAYYFFINKWLKGRLGDTMHWVVCSGIFLYASYRVYRAIVAYQRSNREDRHGQNQC